MKFDLDCPGNISTLLAPKGKIHEKDYQMISWWKMKWMKNTHKINVWEIWSVCDASSFNTEKNISGKILKLIKSDRGGQDIYIPRNYVRRFSFGNTYVNSLVPQICFTECNSNRILGSDINQVHDFRARGSCFFDRIQLSDQLRKRYEQSGQTWITRPGQNPSSYGKLLNRIGPGLVFFGPPTARPRGVTKFRALVTE